MGGRARAGGGGGGGMARGHLGLGHAPRLQHRRADVCASAAGAGVAREADVGAQAAQGAAACRQTGAVVRGGACGARLEAFESYEHRGCAAKSRAGGPITVCFGVERRGKVEPGVGRGPKCDGSSAVVRRQPGVAELQVSYGKVHVDCRRLVRAKVPVQNADGCCDCISALKPKVDSHS